MGCLGHLTLACSTDLWNLLATQLVLFGLREPQLRLPLSAPGLSSSSGLPQSWSHGSSIPREQECCFCKVSWNLSIKLTLLSHSVGQRKVTGLPRDKGWRHRFFLLLGGVAKNFGHCFQSSTTVSSVSTGTASFCVLWCLYWHVIHLSICLTND